jgi:hypothetical protein
MERLEKIFSTKHFQALDIRAEIRETSEPSVKYGRASFQSCKEASKRIWFFLWDKQGLFPAHRNAGGLPSAPPGGQGFAFACSKVEALFSY